MKYQITKIKPWLTVIALSSFLSACENPHTQTYSISITNMTNGQPLSPPVAMLHKKNFSFWQLGDEASSALEKMAEGGDGSALLALASLNPQYQAESPLLPGHTLSFEITSQRKNIRHLSIAGMLVNSNDAFSGLTAIELSDIEAGHKSVYYTYAYDAGTEFNSEAAGTIPGPADGGEGFNPSRDDITSVITLHGGVVSADDNHPDSTLGYADKFDHPVLRIEVNAL